MRSLSEIVQANIDAEAKEARNRRSDTEKCLRKFFTPFKSPIVNRCKFCAERVEDCECDRE